MRAFVPLSVLFWALLLIPACGDSRKYDSALDRVLDKKVLVVGTEPEFKPFESKDADGNFVGFDMDMIRELAKDLGVELRIEEMAFVALIPALQTKKVDMVISGMTVKAKRARKVTFSDSYFETALCLLVHKDSGIEKSEDANGKRIVVKQGTTGQDEAPNLFPKSKDKITVMQAEGECASEVALGRADAFLYDQLSVVGASKKHAKTTRAILTPLSSEPYAMAMWHGDTKMVERINEFLATIRKDGRYRKLREKYLSGLPDGSK